MKRYIVVAVLLVSSAANASELDWKWTKTDTALQVTWTAMHLLDWSQTRKIAIEPNRYYEQNPILGKHPSVGEVDLYMGASTMVNLAIARALPNPYRRYFQMLSIGVTGACVTMNFNIGLGGGDWF